MVVICEKIKRIAMQFSTRGATNEKILLCERFYHTKNLPVVETYSEDLLRKFQFSLNLVILYPARMLYKLKRNVCWFCDNYFQIQYSWCTVKHKKMQLKIGHDIYSQERGKRKLCCISTRYIHYSSSARYSDSETLKNKSKILNVYLAKLRYLRKRKYSLKCPI